MPKSSGLSFVLKHLASVVLLVGGATVAQAQDAVTVEGQPACLTKERRDELMAFAVADDVASIQAYLDRGYCFVMKGGLGATVLDRELRGAEIVVSGTKLWVGPSGIKLR
jgi:hypothetical protein